MGREVRRVPLDWQHPRDNRGEYIPLHDKDYETAAEQWLERLLAWERGDDPHRERIQQQYGERYFWDWDGMPPDRDSYRPKWTEEPAGYQYYENVTEGTPLSPVFRTADELINWLVAEGVCSEHAARRFVKMGFAPSLMLRHSPGQPVQVQTGIESLEEVP